MTQETLARAMGALEAGQPGEADALAREAIAEAIREHGADSPQVAATEFEHAHVLAAAGDVGGAVLAMRRAVAIPAESDDAKKHRLTYLMNLGEALIHFDRLDEAESILTEGALERRTIYGPDHPGYAFGLEPLVDLLLVRNRHQEARAAAEEVLSLFWRHGHRRVANALVLFAYATKAFDGPTAPGLERLYALPAELVVEVVVGCLARAQKLDPAVGLAVLNELMIRARTAKDEDEPWFMHVVAAVSRLARKTADHAAREDALAWLITRFDAIDDRRQALDSVLARALARSEADDHATAETCYRDALSRAEAIGDPLARSRALKSFGAWLDERARPREAAVVLEEAVALAERADPDDPFRAETLEKARAALLAHAN